jgi:3-hydroxyisobutyrate dehydrogenase-like beta-hydroxyacid dehydrogenase
MGLPIARYLLAAGVALRVHNRTPEKAAFPSKLQNGNLV